MFKFYYQVWIFLAVCGGYGIYYWMRHHRNFGVNWRRVGLAIAIVGIGLTGAVTLLSVRRNRNEIGGVWYAFHFGWVGVP